jgi:hypothetical protein
MLTFTLDTNVITLADDPRHERVRVMTELVRLHSSGLISAAVSSRFIYDQSENRDADSQRRLRLAAEPFEQVFGFARPDESYPDLDVPGGDDTDEIVRSLEQLLPRPSNERRARAAMRDVDHLAAHHLHHRDFFLTHDFNTIGCYGLELLSFGIRVLDASCAVSSLLRAERRMNLASLSGQDFVDVLFSDR